MSEEQVKKVFFHVGLGKVASTYLQYRFFPYLKGITYIQRTKYRNYIDIIQKSNSGRFLVSNEFDQQMEGEIKKFAAHFPDGEIIIILRRPDSWIASQYRRFVKNGFALDFTEFLNIDGAKSYWPVHDLYFSKKIEMIESYMHKKPLILLYDDFLKDQFRFFDQIAQFTSCTYSKDEINTKRKHTSYNEKQLKAVRRLSKSLYRQKPVVIETFIFRKIYYFFRRAKSYLIMFIAKLLPASMFTDEELIPSKELERVREFYNEDWQKCLKLAEIQEK